MELKRTYTYSLYIVLQLLESYSTRDALDKSEFLGTQMRNTTGLFGSWFGREKEGDKCRRLAVVLITKTIETRESKYKREMLKVNN